MPDLQPMGQRTYLDHARPSAELLNRFQTFSTPELCDAMGVYNVMDYEVKPQSTPHKIVGPAFTVSVPVGAGNIVARAIDLAQPGDILVLAGRGNCRSSLWGDHRSLCAKLRGLEGVVIDGACRDIEGCDDEAFPIYARAVTCGTAVKGDVGEIGITVACAGAVVRPGDIVVGDRSGVCVIPIEHVEEILERAARKVATQKAAEEAMRQTGRLSAWSYAPQADTH